MRADPGWASLAAVAERPEVAGHRVKVVDPAERLVEQVLDRELGALGERVVGGEHGHASVVEQPLAGETLIGERQPHERDVRLSAPHTAGGVVEAEVPHRHGHVGQLLGKRPEEPRGEVERRGREQADRQLAGLATARRDGRVERRVDVREQRGRSLEQRASRAGQLDLARRPDEQRRAEQRLELAYLRAQRLLRQVEAGRRPREVELLGDRDEGAEMAVLDTHNREW